MSVYRQSRVFALGICCLVVVWALWTTQLVLAQEDTNAVDSFSATGQEVIVSQQEDQATAVTDPQAVEAQIELFRQTFFDQVEQYRDLEQKYFVSRQTYYQNNTLAAQDEAIRQAQELIRIRSRLLQTYLKYLQLELDRTFGIDVSDKALASNLLAAQISDLDTSIKKAGELTNRLQVNQSFTQINTQQDLIEMAAYSTLSLIKMGQTQNAIDQAYTTTDQVEVWLESAQISAASKAKKDRGVEEVRKLLQTAKNNLTELHTRWLAQVEDERYSDSTYKSFQEKLEYSYLQLRQAHAFLEETVNDR